MNCLQKVTTFHVPFVWNIVIATDIILKKNRPCSLYAVIRQGVYTMQILNGFVKHLTNYNITAQNRPR